MEAVRLSMEDTMQIVSTAMAVWLCLCGTQLAAQAQKANACTKDCTDYFKVCRQAHSAQACNSELNICMGFCKKK
jgi:hypothetical protein